jgi:hypothetical protein
VSWLYTGLEPLQTKKAERIQRVRHHNAPAQGEINVGVTVSRAIAVRVPFLHVVLLCRTLHLVSAGQSQKGAAVPAPGSTITCWIPHGVPAGGPAR